MSSSVDYSFMLRAWPAVRTHFAGYEHIQEKELYRFFQRRIPLFSQPMWLAGLQALLRNGLLYRSSSTSLSFSPSEESWVFEPVIEPAWRHLWQQLKAHLTFPLGCLWSTSWLQAVLPPHQPVLVLEVNWSEVRAAMNLLAQHSSYIPVDTLPATILTNYLDAQLVILVRRQQRASPIKIVSAIPTARLEKIVVDLPIIFPTFTPSIQDWQQQVQGYYQVDSACLQKYSAHQQKSRTNNSK